MKHKIVLTAVAAFAVLGATAPQSPAHPVLAARAAAPDEVLVTPTGVAVTEDDHNAILSWNGFPVEDAGSDSVTGYRVTWGRAGAPRSAQVLTTRGTAQLQPLVNGVGYEAEVAAIGADGRMSIPSEVVRFTGDPGRVATLRSTMNGFFDDFSRPTGFPDAARWNIATSACNTPRFDGFFVNAQFHVHNELSSGPCQKAQSVSRPRAVFDFTGRTGTIRFDLDGAQRSDQWYLDLLPNLADITGQVGVEDGLNKVGDRSKDRHGPGGYLRLHQSGPEVEVIWIDNAGYEHLLARGDTEAAGVPLVPNVRRPWEVRINRDHVDLTIGGKAVVSAEGLNLSYSRAHLLWNALSYDTRGNSNEAAFLLHWGNFGFDAPVGGSSPVTHDYTDGSLRVAPPFLTDATLARSINIPDPIEGATAARLMLTLQADPSGGYEWSPDDRVSVNGTVLGVPEPTGARLASTDLVTEESPYSLVLPLSAATLQQGSNAVVVSMHLAQVLNLHLEVDFPAGYSGTYTVPARLAGHADATATPAPIKVGPGVTMNSVGRDKTDKLLAGPAVEAARRSLVVAGRQEVDVDYQEEAALNGTGRIEGVSRLEFLIDGRVVETRRTDLQVGSPAGSARFGLDTTRLSEGRHTIEVRAVDVNGTLSIPDYEASATVSGESRPLHIEVRNHPSVLQWIQGLLRRH